MGETVKLLVPRVSRDDSEKEEPACDGSGRVGEFDCHGCDNCTEESDDE